MSREFASRMKGHVLVRGPREQTEGENSKQKAENVRDKRMYRLTIRIPAQKPRVSKNISAESIGSGSEQISDNASVSAPRDVPNIAVGPEMPDNTVSTTFPPQTLVQHMQDSASGIDIQ